MSSHGANLEIGAAVGFGAGLVWFFKGFGLYREYRVLADTPEIPIRSVAMGLVDIHGQAKGQETISSPVSKTPCFFYKVDVEKWVRDRSGGHWSHAATEAKGLRFYLEDATGKVLVDAHGAELDLIRTARRETGGSSGFSLRSVFSGDEDDSSLTSDSWVSESDLADYAESATGGSLLSDLGIGSSPRYRLSEYCILPEQWYDIAGTCVENPAPQDEHDRNMIVKGQNEPTFLISWRSERDLEGTLRNRAALHIFGGAALSVACLAILLFKLGWL